MNELPEYDFHPLANMFPLIDGEQFNNLVEDIRKNGVQETIWIYEGKILDGRNRYRACKQLKISTQIYEFSGPCSALEFVVSMNLTRRHLTDAQRAMVAVKIKTMHEDEAKARRREGSRKGGKSSGKSRAESKTNSKLPRNSTEASVKKDRSAESRSKAAKALNISPDSVQRAQKIAEYGSIKVNEAINNGSLSLNAAIQILALSKEEQDTLLTKGKAAILDFLKSKRSKKDSINIDQSLVNDSKEVTSIEVNRLQDHISKSFDLSEFQKIVEFQMVSIESFLDKNQNNEKIKKRIFVALIDLSERLKCLIWKTTAVAEAELIIKSNKPKIIEKSEAVKPLIVNEKAPT